MVSRILSKDLENDGIICTALHPGWVQTRMGGEHAAITVSFIWNTNCKSLGKNQQEGDQEQKSRFLMIF